MISIDTKRLHLRNVLQNDVDVIFDYRNNEICARYQRGQVKDYDGIVSLIERRRKCMILWHNNYFTNHFICIL